MLEFRALKNHGSQLFSYSSHEECTSTGPFEDAQIPLACSTTARASLVLPSSKAEEIKEIPNSTQMFHTNSFIRVLPTSPRALNPDHQSWKPKPYKTQQLIMSGTNSFFCPQSLSFLGFRVVPTSGYRRYPQNQNDRPQPGPT